MIVRPATPADLAKIVEIYNQAVTTSVATFDLEPTTVEARAGWFSQFDRENPLLVAEIDDEVAGFAYYLPYRTRPGYSTTKETTIYVDRKRQVSGVGSALYTALIEHARVHGVHVLLAVLGGDNPASVALHRKFGFVEVGRLREVGRKFGQWVDTAYYQLML